MARLSGARLIAAAAMSVSLTGCLAYGGPWIDPGHTPYPYSREDASLRIPPGHMPPPGECRIWYPDRPPGHQPPPGDCYELQRRVPPGAVLVRG